MTITKADHVVTRRQHLSLSTVAARLLATTTKSEPQMSAISPRWLLRMLPWVETKGGVYRVNRRRSYSVGPGRVGYTAIGARLRPIPSELNELPALRGFDDDDVLTALADRFEQLEFQPGEVIAELGHQMDRMLLLAHGKVSQLGSSPYHEPVVLGVLATGEYVGQQVLTGERGSWDRTVKALTPVSVLALPRRSVDDLLAAAPSLREHLGRRTGRPAPPRNKKGEADIAVASGHTGEQDLPGTFADYEPAPRDYELSVAQTVLRVHTRVADVFSEPMDQVEQQLRLTIEALRERQEDELINNRTFGLLHNVDSAQLIHARGGPPTPNDLDNLLCRRRKTRFFLAHPRTIAAVGRECNQRGLDPPSVDVEGTMQLSWRGVPLLPCDKIPITDTGSTSILAMRTGERDGGVIGLRQTGIPDEVEPGMNVRFMGISEQAVMSYLVSAYHSVAVLVPDALGMLDNVEVLR